jgi:hypothetical protein
MNDDLDEFILLLLRTSGRGDAVATYQEETGVNREEAIIAVNELQRSHDSVCHRHLYLSQHRGKGVVITLINAVLLAIAAGMFAMGANSLLLSLAG